MHFTAEQEFLTFSAQFEARVPYMYVDITAKVTVGVGNLIDPIEHALGLPFVFKTDESPASEDDIATDWNRLKNDPSLPTRRYTACDPLTKLKLTEDAIDALVWSKEADFESTLKRTAEFADFDDWPADAQLGLMSMAWAMGPAFGSRWPGFREACGNQDWATAANNCRMNETGNPGVVARNVANKALFETADYIVNQQEDTTILWYTVAGTRPALRSGSRGEHVTFLQTRLAALGYSVSPTDEFDTETDQAFRAFQTDQGMTVDGKVGAVGWAALGTAVPAPALDSR